MDDEISAAELRELLDSGADVRVVDIRSRAAFRRGHIPGSVNVPFQELTGRIEEFDDLDHVVTVCPHGQASVQAARLVSSYGGFSGRVESLAPGIEGWAREYGLETGDGDADVEGETEAEADGGKTDEGPEAPF